MRELKDFSINYFNKYGERFKLEAFLLEEGSDNYSIWLYVIPEDDVPEAIFSTWINSEGGEVSGSQAVYKSNYEDEINIAYKIFNSVMSIMYSKEQSQ